jgi:hypothetical protein
MTILDTTRPRAVGSLPPPGGNGDQLPAGDPDECPACEAAGDPCDFHRGWADGWDACAVFVADQASERRAAEDAR